MKNILFDNQVTEIVIVCTFKVLTYEYRNPTYASISNCLGRGVRHDSRAAEISV